jgi:hypothetical protein
MLNANWAYMAMAVLAWSLKAWAASLLPVFARWRVKHLAERNKLLRMEFRTGGDDEIDDGNQTYTIQVAAAVSDDRNYNGLDLDDVTVINENNDSDTVSENPGITVSAISGNTMEAGGSKKVNAGQFLTTDTRR